MTSIDIGTKCSNKRTFDIITASLEVPHQIVTANIKTTHLPRLIIHELIVYHSYNTHSRWPEGSPVAWISDLPEHHPGTLLLCESHCKQEEEHVQLRIVDASLEAYVSTNPSNFPSSSDKPTRTSSVPTCQIEYKFGWWDYSLFLRVVGAKDLELKPG